MTPPRNAPVSTGFSTIGAIAVDPRGSEVVFATLGDSIWHSEDRGVTWDVAGRVARREGIFALDFHRSHQSRMFAATTAGFYVSEDRGTSWTRTLSPATGYWLACRIRRHPVESDRLIVVSPREVYASTNGGMSWRRLDEDFGGLPWFNDVAVNPARPDQLYVATGTGVYVLQDIWETTVPTENAGALPVGVSLQQNYPNPFNAGTVIRFTVPDDGQASLAIYNMLGQQIRALFDGRTSGNATSISWDGRDDSANRVATGVYLYRLVSGESVESKRMLLLE